MCLVKVDTWHLGAALNAQPRFELAVALLLVHPRELDKAPPGWQLAAVDVCPRVVLLVVVQLAVLDGFPCGLVTGVGVALVHRVVGARASRERVGTGLGDHECRCCEHSAGHLRRA